jgi:hypothetical protein
MKKLLMLVLVALLAGCKYTPPTEPKYTFLQHVRVYNDFSRESPHRSKAAELPKPWMIDTRPVKQDYQYVVSYELN